MKRIFIFIMGLFLTVFPGFLGGCVTDTETLITAKSLPQDKLAYYNDSFDKFRPDLWDMAGYIDRKEQIANFELATMCIENGKLKIKTKTGCFSKGGLGSKYALRGDFDIQIDCQINFLEGTHDIDQALRFMVIEKGQEFDALDSVIVALIKGPRHTSGIALSTVSDNAEFRHGYRHWIGDFDGTLRIIRSGEKISSLYKRKSDSDWKKLNTFRSTSNDVIVGFTLTNFFAKRMSITAEQPIVAIFDNFTINAAEEVIEEEI